MKNKWLKSLITLILCYLLATIVQLSNENFDTSSNYSSEDTDVKNATKSIIRGIFK